MFWESIEVVVGTATPMLGRMIGQLEVKQLLGQGGMGAVYYAEHVLLQTPRAIKILLPQWSQNEMMARRFLNEARAAAKIKHRNVISVHDCGQLEDGTLYIVMDYLKGETLGQCCHLYQGPIPVHFALRLLAPIASGLEAAHRAGIIHRDLKPENVLLIKHEYDDRHPVIVDFGISKFGHEGGVVTHAEMLAGTPAYMSPEQTRGLASSGASSDVYALGVIAFQMVTGGWLPYQGDHESGDEYRHLSPAEIYHRQMSRAPVDPRQRCPSLPERWALAILAALEVDPVRRPGPGLLARLFAEATEGDGFLPSGLSILRGHARDLLEGDNLVETVRDPKQSASASASTPAAGRSARYEIGARLGVGGMAEVFRATALGAEGFARAVALKRVLQGYSTMPQFAAMFVQEAQLAAQLSHANVVSVLDFDRDAEGRLFLVMEWIDGVDLARLAETGLLPFSSVIFVITEVLRGLGYAHDLPLGGSLRGVIHRDVSPHNVLLSWDGAVKVSDFGLAKALDAGGASATDVVKGKPAYMSPEQANAEPLDGRSDLFAVGVIAWQMLTGRKLFDAVTTNGVIAQVFHKVIERPSQVRAGVPRELDAIVMRLLERDLAKRYPTAEVAIEDLSRCADSPRNGRTALARIMAERFNRSVPQVAQAAASSSHHPTTIGSAAAQSKPRAGRRKWPWIAAASVLVVGGVGALAWPGGDASSTPSPAVVVPASPEPPKRTVEPASEVTITIATDPPGAMVRVDGTTRGMSPMTMAVARGARIAVEAQLDGRENAATTAVAERDGQRIELTLAAVASAPVDASTRDVAKEPVATDPAAKDPAAKTPQKKGKRGKDGFDGNQIGGEE